MATQGDGLIVVGGVTPSSWVAWAPNLPFPVGAVARAALVRKGPVREVRQETRSQAQKTGTS